MLCWKDLFDKNRGFRKCAAQLDVLPLSMSMVAVKQYESKSLHRALSNLASFGVRGSHGRRFRNMP